MNDESKTPKNPDESATKGDLAELRDATKADIVLLRNDVEKLRDATKTDIGLLRDDLAEHRKETKADMANLETRLRKHTEDTSFKLAKQLGQQINEIKDHFDVVIENALNQMSEVTKDEVSLIKDQKIPDHEQRIRALEDKAGVATGHLPPT